MARPWHDWAPDLAQPGDRAAGSRGGGVRPSTSGSSTSSPARSGWRAKGDHLDLLPIFDFTLTHNLGVSLGMFPRPRARCAGGWSG
jgi:hypothetical protein